LSLYNNIRESLSSNDAGRSALGGSGAAPGTGMSMAVNAGMGLVNRYMPAEVNRTLVGAVGDLAQGDFESAGMRVIGSGVLNKVFNGLSGIASQMAYWRKPVPLFGGITPTEAKSIYDRMRGQPFSKKNLWLLEVSSRLNGGRMNTELFNLFATEVEYAPFTISGEKRRVGGALVDAVQGNEPVELRLTTMDDKAGTLKRWYAQHHAAAAAEDGTVGVPDDYAIRIRVVHSFITSESNRGGYEDIGLFRPANLELSLSRREDGLQEVQMTFSQLDTFMRP
jgi:hypothetical protein